MCMYMCDGAKINLTELQSFKPSNFRQVLHCRVLSLCNQLFLQFQRMFLNFEDML